MKEMSESDHQLSDRGYDAGTEKEKENNESESESGVSEARK
jgi:hypothetical protein